MTSPPSTLLPVAKTLRPCDKTTLSRMVQKEIKRLGMTADLNHIDVSGVDDFSEIFLHCAFNGDISRWDVSNAVYMHRMFEDSAFDGDISQWNVSGVVSMNQMFGASAFSGDITAWDVSNVRNFRQMFHGAVKFDRDISHWNIHRKANVLSMFSGKQLLVAKYPIVFHWRCAEVGVLPLAPALQAHYNKYRDVCAMLSCDPVERSYAMQEQWMLDQRQDFSQGPADAVDPGVFEAGA